MKLRHSFLVFATLASITTLISAQTATWSLTSGDSWNTTANWSTDPTVPDSTTSIADFTQDFIDTPVITLDKAAGFTVNGNLSGEFLVQLNEFGNLLFVRFDVFLMSKIHAIS